MTILDNALVKRQLETPYSDGLYTAVPWELIRQIREHGINTPDEQVFQALDYIGIEAIVDIISQGAFLSDIASSLDIPVTKIDRWLRQEPTRVEGVAIAERYAAEHHLSLAIREVMNVSETDVDRMKVAKVKADLQKWVATRKDRDKYGDKVSHQHSGDVGVEFHITLSNHVGDQPKVIDI